MFLNSAIRKWWKLGITVGIIVVSIGVAAAILLRPHKEELVFKRDFSGVYSAHVASTQLTMSLQTEANGAKIGVKRGDASLEIIQPLTAPQLQTNKEKAIYKDASQNVELHYTLQPKGLKEDIVLLKQPKEYIFASQIKLSNVVAHINSAGIPIFTDKQGTYQFHFEKPYAVDAKGERTESVRYHLIPAKDATNSAQAIAEKGKEKIGTKKLFGIEEEKLSDQDYVLMTEVDPKWLQDPKRAFPVTIDPTVVHDTSSEFATGQLNNGKDIGSGSSPSLQTYYGELPMDEYTVGLWHMDELVNDQCPVSGEDVCDTSGQLSDGTQSGGAAINTTTQKIGTAARTFDGTDDFITVGDSNSLSFTNNVMTAEAWIKRSGNPAAAEYVMLKGAASNWEYAMIVNTTGLFQCQMWIASGASSVSQVISTSTVTDGGWHHVACVSTGTTYSVYIDGKLDNTSNTFSSVMTNGTASLFFGDRADVANSEFQGDIDEIRLSRVARTADEIAASAARRPYSVFTSDYVDFGTPIASWNNLTFTEYNVQTGDGETATSSSGLVAAWNMNATSGTTVANNAGAGTCGGTASNCDGVLTNVADTSGQDVAALSGWTANNRKWGAGAISFDGSNDFVDIANTSGLDVANNASFSVEGWIKGTANGRVIFLAQNDGNHGLIYWSIGPTTLTGTANKLVAYLRVDGVGAPITVVSGATTINDNQWHHVALTSIYNGSTRDVTMYVDGKVDATTTMQNGAMTFSFGGTSDIIISAGSGGFTFLGTIDSVRWWSRGLSSSDILSHYQVGGLELQTRVGADTTPNDGDWEDWKPVISETQIDSMANVVGWATPSASIFPGAQIATFSSTVIKAEGTSALKIEMGKVSPAANQVALWHFDETGETGAYLKDSAPTASVSNGDGVDGAVTISSSKNLNTQTIAGSRSFADGIAYRVTPPSDGSSSVTRHSGSDTLSNGIAAGDEVLLINLQGATSDTTDVGNYEFKEVQSVSASTITFTSAITKSFDGTTPANQKVVVQRVPNYTNVTIQSGGTLTASAWDGLTTTPTGAAGYLTGIVTFRASGTVDVQSGGTITANSLGYQGAPASSTQNVYGSSATGTAGTGSVTATCTANTNGGGGGSRAISGSNDAGGGGGGGHGAAGSNGVQVGGFAALCQGIGGSAIGDVSLSQMFFGGGGGNGGTITGSAGTTGPGGQGGGIIFISGATVSNSGSITANGQAGTNSSGTYAGGAGGGAGGSIYIAGTTISLGSSTVTATGGTGGTRVGTNPGSGGAGAVGRVHLQPSSAASTLSGTTSPSYNIDYDNGTPSNTFLTNGITGKARQFVPASSSNIAVTDSSALDLTGGNFSISLWVNPGLSQSANADIFSKHNGSSVSGYALEMNGTPNSNVYYFTWGTGSAFQCTGTTITLTPNVWQHVAITKSGTALTLYVNGASAGSCTGGSATVAANTDSLYFSRLATSAARFWNGSMDEVMITTAVMTADEVQEQYKAGFGQRFSETISSTDFSTKKNVPFYIAADRPGNYLQATLGESEYVNYESDSNTIGFWHLEESQTAGATIKDASGNGRHGTPSGPDVGTGVLGNSRFFGTGDDISLGNLSMVDSLANVTIDAWVYPTAQTAATHFRVFSEELVLYVGQFADQASFYMGNGASWTITETAGGTLKLNQWNHVTWVKSGTSYFIYINGVLTKSGTGAPATLGTTSTTNYISTSDGSTQPWNGFIDEVRISNSVRTADQARQTAEMKDRTFPININFGASLASTNLVTGSTDLSFDVYTGDYGTKNRGENLYWGDKIIVKENIDGVEYLAQGTVQSVNSTTGEVRVNSWDSGSTFPSGGFTTDSTVFKWERQYWNITKPLDSHLDAVTRLTFFVGGGAREGRTIYLDDFRSATDYLTTPGGSTITSSTGYRFLQYRMVQSLVDYNNASPALTSLTLDYSLKGAPNTPTLDSPADTATNQTRTPTLQTTATDSDSDYLRYKIELCTNVGMTTGCNTFDQTTSQTGWSGQDAQTSTAYTSGTQASFTVPSGILQYNTTYYWRSYAIDPGGSNTWSGTQTPRSFTVVETPFPPSCTLDKDESNANIIVKWTDIFTNETNFTVEKNTDNAGFSSLTTPAANATSTTDSSVSNGHTYQYRVRANLGSNTTEWCTTTTISLDTGFLNID